MWVLKKTWQMRELMQSGLIWFWIGKIFVEKNIYYPHKKYSNPRLINNFEMNIDRELKILLGNSKNSSKRGR